MGDCRDPNHLAKDDEQHAMRESLEPRAADIEAFHDKLPLWKSAGVEPNLFDQRFKLIQKFTANYELNRLAAVDRNILRVAIYELLHSLDVAPVVIINEAIEVAKKFGTEKSGGFVNGVLDRIKKDINRPAREAAVPRAQVTGGKGQATADT